MSESKTICVRSEGDVCFAVIDTVSKLTTTDPLDLEPLGTVVDTDAVETLFGPGQTGIIRHDADLSFRYEGCDVTVGNDGTVSVTRPTAMTESSSDSPVASTADASAAGDRGDADAW